MEITSLYDKLSKCDNNVLYTFLCYVNNNYKIKCDILTEKSTIVLTMEIGTYIDFIVDNRMSYLRIHTHVFNDDVWLIKKYSYTSTLSAKITIDNYLRLSTIKNIL